MVSEHFAKLGFSLAESSADGSKSVWRYDTSATYLPKNKTIKEITHG